MDSGKRNLACFGKIPQNLKPMNEMVGSYFFCFVFLYAFSTDSNMPSISAVCVASVSCLHLVHLKISFGRQSDVVEYVRRNTFCDDKPMSSSFDLAIFQRTIG